MKYCSAGLPECSYRKLMVMNYHLALRTEFLFSFMLADEISCIVI